MQYKVNVFALAVEVLWLSRSGSSVVMAGITMLLKSAQQTRATKASVIAGAF